MTRVAVQGTTPLAPADAVALWSDPHRWPSFVEGFGTVERLGDDWPRQGATIVWWSVPGGVGQVTEKVTDSTDRAFETRRSERRLHGIQRADFAAAAGSDATRVELSLDYEPTQEAPLAALFDLLYLRRVVRSALARQLQRFAIEASEEAELRAGIDSR